VYCFGEDFQGCFDGGYEFLNTIDALNILEKLGIDVSKAQYSFDIYVTSNLEQLKAVGEYTHKGTTSWHYEILDEDDNSIFDSGVENEEI
jgi:hypothetical protein